MQISRLPKNIRSIMLSLIVLALYSCAPRSYTKPHSQVVAEAKRAGVQVRTVEEDLQLFEEHEKKNREKLYSLLKKRDVIVADKERESDYVLAPGDEIQLAVFGVDELNTKARIAQTGTVSLPLIGMVELGGLTELQATDRLKGRLSGHLRDPQVVLSISDYSGHQVSVVGAVAHPGKQILRKDRNTLLEVVGAAGGLTKEAGNFVTFIAAEEADSKGGSLVDVAKSSLEEGAGSMQTDQGIEVPVAAAFGLNSTSPVQIPLRGGDIILVQPSGQVMVEGEVEKRGQFNLGENATLVGALAAAGGISYGAQFDEVEIVRRLGNQEKVTLLYDLEMIQSGAQENPYLKNGDIVRVPSATGKRFSQDVFKAVQGFINFGLGGRLPL
jgi:polysaccharide export outer membrane protein